jgi:hypothetical protein
MTERVKLDIPALCKQFHEQGYLVLRNVLPQERVARINQAIDEVLQEEEESLSYNIYHCVNRHPEVASLIDEPSVLPLLVNLLGYNIQLFISNLTVRRPRREGRAEKSFGSINWHQDGPSFGFPGINGRQPLMYIRAAYILSDLSEPNRGNTKIIPGSHKIPYFAPNDRDVTKHQEGEVQVCGQPGDVFLFGQNVWHAGAPNFSDIERRLIILGYSYMWLRPNDYIAPSQELLKNASPVRRQLLGEVFDSAGTAGGAEGGDAVDPILKAMTYHQLRKKEKELPLYPFFLNNEDKGKSDVY